MSIRRGPGPDALDTWKNYRNHVISQKPLDNPHRLTLTILIHLFFEPGLDVQNLISSSNKSEECRHGQQY